MLSLCSIASRSVGCSRLGHLNGSIYRNEIISDSKSNLKNLQVFKYYYSPFQQNIRFKYTKPPKSKFKFENPPLYQNRQNFRSYVVIFSLGVFMFYFFYYREENDIDEFLEEPLWEKVPGIDPDICQKMMEFDQSIGLKVKELYLQQLNFN